MCTSLLGLRPCCNSYHILSKWRSNRHHAHVCLPTKGFVTLSHKEWARTLSLMTISMPVPRRRTAGTWRQRLRQRIPHSLLQDGHFTMNAQTTASKLKCQKKSKSSVQCKRTPCAAPFAGHCIAKQLSERAVDVGRMRGRTSRCSCPGRWSCAQHPAVAYM